jgi:CheY-specific phosphatase CheX
MGQSVHLSFEKAVLDIFRENAIAVESIAPSGKDGEKLQVVSTMGISGDLWGNVIFGCSLESAQAIVDSLFKSSQIVPQEKGFGDLQKATIGEFTNQITGRALMALAQDSVDCMMTPPTVFTGNWVVPELSGARDEEYVSRVQGDFGSAVLKIGFKALKKGKKNS